MGFVGIYMHTYINLKFRCIYINKLNFLIYNIFILLKITVNMYVVFNMDKSQKDLFQNEHV